MGEKEGFVPFPSEFETICIHHEKLIPKPPQTEKCRFIAPIYYSNFLKGEFEGIQQCVEGRHINPTRLILEKLLAKLNKVKFSLVFSSGMGAITALLKTLKCGDQILCCEDIYGGTRELLLHILPKYGITSTFADFHKPDCVREAITPNTKMIWMENPTNPKLNVYDICAITEIAHSKNVLTTVDNSLLTPYFQTPSDFNVDITVQAMAKLLNGHSDVVMGAVSTSDENIYNKVKYMQTHFGHVPCPFDCFQVIRGLKTLPLRLRRHHSSSKKIAEFLTNHPKIEKVLYPAHPSHPQHDLFKRTTSGMSGMICFYIKGGKDDTKKFFKNLKLFYTTVSFGGYESLIGCPGFMSHRGVPEEVKKTMGYTNNFVRMSVGLEDPNDLINDLEQSLKQIP